MELVEDLTIWRHKRQHAARIKNVLFDNDAASVTL